MGIMLWFDGSKRKKVNVHMSKTEREIGRWVVVDEKVGLVLLVYLQSNLQRLIALCSPLPRNRWMFQTHITGFIHGGELAELG